jgi:hypothetical protein
MQHTQHHNSTAANFEAPETCWAVPERDGIYLFIYHGGQKMNSPRAQHCTAASRRHYEISLFIAAAAWEYKSKLSAACHFSHGQTLLY